MWVEVQIHGGLGSRVGRLARLEIEPRSTVRDIARRLGIPLEKVGMIVADGRLCGADDLVEDVQRISFFPPIMGG